MPWEVTRLGILTEWALANQHPDAAFEVAMWVLRCASGPPAGDDLVDGQGTAVFSDFMITYSALPEVRLIVIRSVIGPF